MSTCRAVTKTVALADDAYEALARLKGPGESFSDVVRSLVASRRPRLRDVAGLAQQDQQHWEAFRRERGKARRGSRRRVDLGGPE